MPPIPPEYGLGLVATLLLLATIEIGFLAARESRLAALRRAIPDSYEAALHYGDNRWMSEQSGDAAHPALLGLAASILTLGEAGDTGNLIVAGFLLLVVLIYLPHNIARLRRELVVRPAIAVRPHGLELDGWRGRRLLRWDEIDLVYTDPPESSGYVAEEQEVTLHVEAKDGRRWRFSSRHFPEGAPADFADLAALALRRMAPTGSMLNRPD